MKSLSFMKESGSASTTTPISAPRLLKRDEVSSITKQQILEMERQLRETMGMAFNISIGDNGFEDVRPLPPTPQQTSPLPLLPVRPSFQSALVNAAGTPKSSSVVAIDSPQTVRAKPLQKSLLMQIESKTIHGKTFKKEDRCCFFFSVDHTTHTLTVCRFIARP
jgi:hypothetical protein